MSQDEGKATGVTYLDNLTDKQRSDANSAVAAIRAQVKEEMEKVTDPATRPGFPGSQPDDDLKHFSKYEKAVVSDLTGQTLRHKTGGYLPPTSDYTTDDRIGHIKEAIAGGFNINLFPRGDIENFAVTRWAMAMERATRTSEGSSAFNKYAPWENQFYHACEKLAASNKAMGDMVSGQDGGYLAPEEWSTRFIDQLYPAMALSRLPVTRIPMGTRVTHVPRLNSNIAINYGAENAALTANQAQFQQVSFTARKQAFLVQVSNELIRDSNPAAEAILRNNATRYLAIDRDKQSLLGNGQAGTPTGLLKTTNVTVSGGSAAAPYATQAAPVFTDFNTAIFNVENLNGSSNVPVAQATCTGVVGPVVLKQQVMNMADTTNNRPIYSFGIDQMRGTNRPDGSTMLDGLFGIPTWVLTNILAGAANSRNVFFGDWQHLWIMERQDVEILSSNVAGTAFQNDQTWIRGITRYDVGVAHPEAFYVVNNA